MASVQPSGVESRPIRARFVGDAMGWIIAAFVVLLLGVVGITSWRIMKADSGTVGNHVFSPEASSWLAGSKEVAVYRDGKMFLYGTVNSEAERQQMIDMASAALGGGNVVAEEYYVDPSVPKRSGAAVMRVADPVLFEFNSTAIAPNFEPILDFVATMLRQSPTVTVRVTGHTDDIGADEANLRLSDGRAQAAVAALVARGIDPSRVSGQGYGAAQPMAPNSDENGRRLNRRVEFELSGLA